MGKGISNQTKLIAVVLPIALVIGVASFIFAPTVDDFVEFGTGIEDNFALIIQTPPQLFSVVGADSFLIKCTLQNQIDVYDTSGRLQQRILKTSPQFSPAIELDFLIGAPSGQIPFGRADVKTTISCLDNVLSSQGFGAFLYAGSVTTKITGTNFDGKQLDLVSKSRSVSGLTDLTANSLVLVDLTVSESTIDRILKDDKDYVALMKVSTIGELKFRQCVIGEFCLADDRNASWLHTISSGDAFTAFGLIVEGAEFAPTTSIQELVITDPRLESLGNKINIAEGDCPTIDCKRVLYKIRLKDFMVGLDSIPKVEVRDGNNVVRQVLSAGILTQTEEGGAFHVKDMSYTIQSGETGLFCFTLLRDESGVRTPSKKCITAYIGDNEEKETETGGDETADINSGEVRLRYEVTTTSGVIQNDITMAGGIPVIFSPLQLIGVSDQSTILKIWLQPQIFFSEGVLKNLNIVVGSADIKYTGLLKLPESSIKINAIDFTKNPADFTKNQQSIILPSTSITTADIEKLLAQQGKLPTNTTPITLEILSSGTFQLKESDGSIKLGTFDGAKFAFNLDYIPPSQTGGDDCSSSSPPASCGNPDECIGGVIIANTCIFGGDETKCFDANGNIVDCEKDNDPMCIVGIENEVAGVCIPIDFGNGGNGGDLPPKCFDANGDVISCDKDVDVDCDPNTDPDRCGGGGFTGNPADDPPKESETGLAFLCGQLVGTVFECKELGEDIIDTTMPFELDFSGQLTTIAIVVGAGISLIIIIAIIIRIVKNR